MDDFLQDIPFLQQLDNYNTRVQYAKIILLSFDEKPLKEITGSIQNGNLNINGSAAIRRTINLTMLIPNKNYFNINDLDNDISLNKKIKIFIGYNNPFIKTSYPDILWFPCGIFLISSASCSKGINNWTISIQGKDKMVLLDGTVGGKLPAPVVFHEMEDVDESGNIIIKHPTIFQIIQEAVHHWGEENPGKIIINDIDENVKMLVKYIGDKTIYFDENYYSFSEDRRENQYVNECKKGQDIGYRVTPFIYPGELILNMGESVVTLLTKICELLGNYEFFYDLNGNFIFQQKKNYLNYKSPLKDLNEQNYLITYNTSKNKYDLSKDKTISAISINPQYQNIKNDFIIWGKKSLSSGIEYPIHYHLVIDDKPMINVANQYLWQYIYACSTFTTEPSKINFNNEKFSSWLTEDSSTYKILIYNKNKDNTGYWTYNLKKIQLNDIGVNLETEDKQKLKNNDKIYFYLGYEGIKKSLSKTEQAYILTIEDNLPDNLSNILKKQYIKIGNPCSEWREELYRLALISDTSDDKYQYYYAELLTEWRNIFNTLKFPRSDGWDLNKIENPTELTYWLDFIDNNNILDKYSVSNIGRRLEVVEDTTISTIYNIEPQNIIFKKRTDETDIGLDDDSIVFWLSESMDKFFITSSTNASAFDKIRELLYIHLNYNTQVTITCLPKYYLEPNNIVYIEDKATGIIGNYFISQISLPLNHSGTMNITATEILTRI